MSTSSLRTVPRGPRSDEHGPQVVVRAGKHYVCSGCGTWVEIPADVVGQWVIVTETEQQAQHKPRSAEARKGNLAKDNRARGEAGNEKAILPEARVPCPRPGGHADRSSKESLAGYPTGASRSHAHADEGIAPRPAHPKTPPRVTFAGQSIDGLVVPTAGKLDRAVAWVMFQLRVLDRQEAEYKQLRKVLKKRRRQQGPTAAEHWSRDRSDTKERSRGPCLRPRGYADRSLNESPAGVPSGARRRHAHADEGMAPQNREVARKRDADSTGTHADLSVASNDENARQRGRWVPRLRPRGDRVRSSRRLPAGTSVGDRRRYARADVGMAPRNTGTLTRWHKRPAALAGRLRLRRGKRIQGRGPP